MQTHRAADEHFGRNLEANGLVYWPKDQVTLTVLSPNSPTFTLECPDVALPTALYQQMANPFTMTNI